MMIRSLLRATRPTSALKSAQVCTSSVYNKHKAPICESHGYRRTFTTKSWAPSNTTSQDLPNANQRSMQELWESPFIRKVSSNDETSMVQIYWEGETKPSCFPYVWLKDNCQCPECFHPTSHSRGNFMKDLDVNIKPAHITNTKEFIQIHWTDNHVSKFSSDWLHHRDFQNAQQAIRDQVYRLERIHWGSDLIENLPQIEFSDIMENDSILLSWLQQLEQYGLVIIAGAPTTGDQVTKLTERVAFVKRTHYGKQFDVIAKPSFNNPAYSTKPLPLHADLPYYEYKPGVQLIHCLVQYQGKGGESQVTDAVHVAQVLEKKHPEKYNILKNVLVDWFDLGSDVGGTFHKILRQPVICTDFDGKYIKRINFSHAQRDSFFNLKAEEVHAWYDAMKTYHDLLHHPDYCINFKMLPGTILTFDNIRIVHGRTGFENKTGERHIQGCYIDWDEVRSRRRVLETTI